MLKDIVLEPGDTDATEFTVSYWKVDPGCAVVEGDELVVLESVDDKTAFSVTARHDGVLKEILTAEDATVEPGQTLGRIETE